MSVHTAFYPITQHYGYVARVGSGNQGYESHPPQWMKWEPRVTFDYGKTTYLLTKNKPNGKDIGLALANIVTLNRDEYLYVFPSRRRACRNTNGTHRNTSTDSLIPKGLTHLSTLIVQVDRTSINNKHLLEWTTNIIDWNGSSNILERFVLWLYD